MDRQTDGWIDRQIDRVLCFLAKSVVRAQEPRNGLFSWIDKERYDMI